jgi:hypothetical protein
MNQKQLSGIGFMKLRFSTQSFRANMDKMLSKNYRQTFIRQFLHEDVALTNLRWVRINFLPITCGRNRFIKLSPGQPNPNPWFPRTAFKNGARQKNFAPFLQALGICVFRGHKNRLKLPPVTSLIQVQTAECALVTTDGGNSMSGLLLRNQCYKIDPVDSIAPA